jgi:hypothetical protein
VEVDDVFGEGRGNDKLAICQEKGLYLVRWEKKISEGAVRGEIDTR